MADYISWFDRNIGFHVADAANWLVDDVLGVTKKVNFRSLLRITNTRIVGTK